MFKKAKDFVFCGRKVSQRTTALEISFDKSLYADDQTKLAQKAAAETSVQFAMAC
jgi:hypothetical protein